MTKTDQRVAYALYFVATSVVTGCLAVVWYLSPLGLGFKSWPEANRDVLEHLYQASYWAGIPAILIAPGLSLVLFIFRNQKGAYWLPAVSIGLFLTCIVTLMSNLN